MAEVAALALDTVEGRFVGLVDAPDWLCPDSLLEMARLLIDDAEAEADAANQLVNVGELLRPLWPEQDDVFVPKGSTNNMMDQSL